MTIKEYWPEMSRNLPASVQETAKKFGAKAIDINAFLVDVLGVHPEARQGWPEGDVPRILPPEEIPRRQQAAARAYQHEQELRTGGDGGA